MAKAKHISKITKIIEIKRGITPEENRYIDKQVRERLKLQMPKTPKKLPEYLNAAEITYMLESTQNNILTNLLVEYQIMTGSRIGETTKQLIQHIDWDNNQIKIVEGKGKKDRYIPLHLGLKRRLLTHLQGRKKGYLFCKKNLTKYSTRALQKRIVNAYLSCNFSKHLTTHSLRHTFACMLMSKGMPIESIQLVMGHSSVKTTEIYAKLELGPVKEQFQRLLGNV